MLMLMMHPLPQAFKAWKAALHMVKVPSVSMSNTAQAAMHLSLLVAAEC